MKAHAPLHPGEILQEDFLAPLGLLEYRVAKDIAVPPRRINEIVKGKRDMTFETLNRPDFIDAVKKAFSDQNWDKVYNEIRAAGEKKSSNA